MVLIGALSAVRLWPGRLALALRYGLDRLRHPAGRAQTLWQLRLRLLTEPPPANLSEAESKAASRLRELRAELLTKLGPVRACTRCAKSYPPPHGAWDGGYCCGGYSELLFTEEELACLHASGTEAWDLMLPETPQAGCVFRGAKGCSLLPAHRPNLCVQYACNALRMELRQRADWPELSRLGTELQLTFAAFRKARECRLLDESFGPVGQSSSRSRPRGRQNSP